MTHTSTHKLITWSTLHIRRSPENIKQAYSSSDGRNTNRENDIGQDIDGIEDLLSFAPRWVRGRATDLRNAVLLTYTVGLSIR